MYIYACRTQQASRNLISYWRAGSFKWTPCDRRHTFTGQPFAYKWKAVTDRSNLSSMLLTHSVQYQPWSITLICCNTCVLCTSRVIWPACQDACASRPRQSRGWSPAAPVRLLTRNGRSRAGQGPADLTLKHKLPVEPRSNNCMRMSGLWHLMT